MYGLAAPRADAAADLDAIHAGHHPIENRQPRRILGLQSLPGFDTVARDGHVIAPLGQHGAEHRLKDQIVFGCQNAQWDGRRTGQGKRFDVVIAIAGGQMRSSEYTYRPKESELEGTGTKSGANAGL